jgi:hypothetical protein
MELQEFKVLLEVKYKVLMDLLVLQVSLEIKVLPDEKVLKAN